MTNNYDQLGFENNRLNQTISIAEEQLSSLRKNSEKVREEILEAKKQLREETNHSLSNLWVKDKFYDLIEIGQYAKPISHKISEYEVEAAKIIALEKLLNSPYFARIDFKFQDEDEYENIYIGRSSLIDDDSSEIYVYDWRSPISSIFYRFGIGEAFYEAPSGKITGEVNLKRQYEINKGKLEYFFDADIQIIDEFLRKMLSQNTSSKMKTIVETIQKDQDMIIRNMEMDLMMVQGVAGSGKTSVALHRAAYLMYQGLSDKLSSNNILIISPNTLFEQYISNVLPELGEKNVNSKTFEELIINILNGSKIETRNELLETLLSSNNNLIKNSMEFKCSSEFVEILNRFINDLPRKWIDFKDVYYDGKHISNRQLSKNKILNEKRAITLSSRLKQLETSILEEVHKNHKTRLEKLTDFVTTYKEHSFELEETARMLSIYESTNLIKEIRKFTELNPLELYRKLFTNKGYFFSLSKGIDLPENIEDILDFTFKNLNNDVLSYGDAVALSFLNLKLNTNNGYSEIRQIVIDEAQDYYPIHFEILNLLFPKSRYTILGDINQTIGKQENLSLYERLNKILCKKKSTLITMDKSFRSTSEILEFSKKFLNDDFKINSFSRKGNPPIVHSSSTLAELKDNIINEIKTSRENNYKSIGLICKTEKEASSLYEILKDEIQIKLIKSDSMAALDGTFIIPIYLSKGLEFDSVLILNTDKNTYYSKDDKNLLYIACTRALHRLSLFFTGEISPLL
ncbi:HelD family protein [Clostridium intestinale]|uniref:DNA 3'-5' helicase n=1 Tax=Clostridium intestinale TaxID=36845 RepID=A0A7D6ZXN7_9CLOT|nr:UvrD-helicase domain-containing protein [Clostridium intestinale]QLY78175.1 UvrD-helicase domain-containing protein [Clostridium intestinale]